MAKEMTAESIIRKLRCVECGNGFRIEYYEYKPLVENIGEVLEDADHVFSFTHDDCKEES